MLLGIKFKQYLNFCTNSSNNFTSSSEINPEEPRPWIRGWL